MAINQVSSSIRNDMNQIETGENTKKERSFIHNALQIIKYIAQGIIGIIGYIIIIPLIIIGFVLVMWGAKYAYFAVLIGLASYVIGLVLMYLLGFLFHFEQKFDIVHTIACLALGALISAIIYFCFF